MNVHHRHNRLADVCASVHALLGERHFRSRLGAVTRIEGGRIIAETGPVAIGEICQVIDRTHKATVNAQVVSVARGETVLAAIEPIHGLSAQAEVIQTGGHARVPVGDGLIGRIVDGLGRPLDGLGAIDSMRDRAVAPDGRVNEFHGVIDETLETGVRAIDLFNTMGVGQRIAVFGPPGAGKSTLMSMITRHTQCDVIVVAMIGERGREVREFIDRQLPPAVRKRCVTVVSTSDRPAMERVLAGHSALAIAEDFRASGKNVLLVFDSVTRFARALREIGLAAGEQAVRMGFTPSVYAELPRLIERAGKTRDGAITALFTVLLENEGKNDPIAEEVNSLVDGYLMLDTRLAASGHYPAIDIERSKSRLMREVAPEGLVEQASAMRAMLGKYREIELLIQVGEYVPGSDPDADRAIAARPHIAALTKQDVDAPSSIGEGMATMQAILNGLPG